VTGLGYLFATGSLSARLRRALLVRGLRFARHPNLRVVVQNDEDGELLLHEGIIQKDQLAWIRGSGVDLDRFRARPEPPGPPLVVLCARLVWQKGVQEFVDAAAALHREGCGLRFALIGEPDPGNPLAVPRDRLQGWAEAGLVEWWGHREDVPAVFAAASVVCLPSTYREGVPKVLLEAAAAGRPIITTDVPGCRDVVSDGVNGLLVAPGSASSLADALRRLARDPVLRARLGRAGRVRAEREFGVERVVEATLNLYQELLSRVSVGPDAH
jgi:glycosyltransferase involved in cell wall biosynthesis